LHNLIADDLLDKICGYCNFVFNFRNKLAVIVGREKYLEWTVLERVVKVDY